MKVFVRKEALRQMLGWARRAFCAGGILLLGYCAFILMDAWLFQRRASRDLDRQQRDGRTAGLVTPQPVSVTVPGAAPLAEGSLLGRVEIPRLALSVMVVEGDDKISLRRAVGHIPGTALPGKDGNVGLAGHRDTFFLPLKDVKVHDEIRISTPTGNFKYQVVSVRIVDPENVGVLAPSGENVLTLVTCYPFYFIGAAPKRWIVRARQVSSQTGTQANVK